MAGEVRAGRYGAWLLACAVPAALVSAVLIASVARLVGRWWLLGVVGWVAVGFLLLHPAVERRAVAAWCRFRKPVGVDDAWLEWLRVSVEQRCALPAGRLDWYVRGDDVATAYAAGRRSVAVSTGLLRLLYTGRLSSEQAVAIGVHEVGHHVTGGTRYGLLAHWLCWPWQATYQGCMRLGRRMPFADAAIVLLPVIFGVAIVNVATEDQSPEHKIPVLVLLCTLALCIFVHPLASAMFARAGEYAADRYAARCGLGLQLATALHHVDACPAVLWGGLRASHPPTAERIRRLQDTMPAKRSRIRHAARAAF